MLDIKFIKDNPERIKENIKKRFQEQKIPLVDKVIKNYDSWLELKKEAEELRHKRNVISEKINLLKKHSKDASSELKQVKEIPEKIKKLEEKQDRLDQEIKKDLMLIPNIIHPSVPIGRDDSQNVEIKKIGKPKKFSYEIKNHAELVEKLGLADFDSAAEISGKGFYILKGKLAMLDMALINFARDYMLKQGFEFIHVPYMIKKRVVEGVMSFKEMENMMYKIEGEDLYLIGTSEHPMIGMFINKTLKKDELPIKITGFSPCFRKEIGSHGIDEKGLFRVHQFHKQEMIVICEPKDSYKWYDKMLKFTVDIFKQLEIPTRILEICSGDLADLKAKSCDVEAWSPRQNKYFEVGSLTNMEEAQARRLGIKIQGNNGKYYAHTLNNTVLATSRAMVAILENHQQKDGTIKIPKALQKYMGGLKEIK